MSHPSRYAPPDGTPGTTGEPPRDDGRPASDDARSDPVDDRRPAAPDGRPEPSDGGRSVPVPPTELLELLDDQYARTILEATSEEALRARELIERCEASKPTVYRRLNRLEDAGLVASRQAFDPDGHHCQVFRATFEAAVVDLGPDGIDAELSVASRP